MSVVKFTVKDGKITSYDGKYERWSISEDGLRAECNQWDVMIEPRTEDEDGKIIAHCQRMYGGKLATCHEEYPLRNGMLCLSGGPIYKRYTYFRKEKSQKLLDELGLTAVKREDPNQKFEWYEGSRKLFLDAGYTIHQEIETDGVVEDRSSRNLIFHRVSGATWAIVKRSADLASFRHESRTLYTLSDGDLAKVGEEIRRHRNRVVKIEYVKSALRSGKYWRTYKTMEEMRMVIEEAIGFSFPKTLAEFPGMDARVRQYGAAVHGDKIRMYADDEAIGTIQL